MQLKSESRYIFKCFCGRIHIKHIGLPICVCDSDHFDVMTEKELRKLKLNEIERG